MNTIFKFVLRVTDYQQLAMPTGAKLLHVEEQHNAPCLWALIDNDNETEIRRFKIHGTGHPIDLTNLKYIGTFQIKNQLFVGHLFEVI